jgi:hypothetical protein
MVASVIEAQRATLNDLQRSGDISDDIKRRVEHELDLEEGRFLS